MSEFENNSGAITCNSQGKHIVNLLITKGVSLFKQVILILTVFSTVQLLTKQNAHADLISTFDTDADGWSVTDFANLESNDYAITATFAVTYNATGGTPGGYISESDPSSQYFTFSAPAKFLGNVTGATGLSYDLTHPTGYVGIQAADVILVGNGTRLVWMSNPGLAPNAGWTNVNMAFAPSSAWHVETTTGSLATATDFQTVLGNLSELYIRGEYTNGDEVTGLDNIHLTGTSAVPEPASLMLFSSAGILYGISSRVKNRKKSVTLKES